MSTYPPVTTSGTTTSYIPLTTAFSAPAACKSLFLENNSVGPAEGAFQLFAWDSKYASVAGGGPQCMPEAVSRWWSQDSSSQTTVKTELGGYNMNCPQAYTTLSSFAANTETTTIGCCPSSYTFATLMAHGLPGQCFSVIPAGVITYLQPGPSTTIPWTTTSSAFPSPYTIWAVQVNGFIFPNPNPTGTTTISSSTSSTSSTSSISSTRIPGPSSGIGSGAKAGIGIAVALGIIGLVALLGAWLLFRRRRQAYTVPPENVMSQKPGGIHETVEQPGFEMGAQKEHYDTPAAELEEQRYQQPTIELDAAPRTRDMR